VKLKGQIDSKPQVASFNTGSQDVSKDVHQNFDKQRSKFEWPLEKGDQLNETLCPYALRIESLDLGRTQVSTIFGVLLTIQHLPLPPKIFFHPVDFVRGIHVLQSSSSR